ncbi:hypothetical protein [Staphylococcus aureus]|nr:hypothetical protein [Staphylococcus aureus]MCG2340089.1 hypothetical protein [Staphylococcus epidermidis]
MSSISTGMVLSAHLQQGFDQISLYSSKHRGHIVIIQSLPSPVYRK